MITIDRLRRRFRDEPYDPLRGIGCGGERVEVYTPVEGLPRARVPATMTADPDYVAARADSTAWERLRCRHDFEYWCARCVRVKDKESWRDVSFVLNAPQRRVAALLEADRLAGLPLRMILLKARQWGGSTLVQMYMAWIQCVHRRNWHSVICAHVKDTSATIRGMYTKMLAAYPEALWEGDAEPEFKPFERSTNIRTIEGRDCRVTVATAEKPDGIRGSDIAMAHLSEVAYWPDTLHRSAESVVQAIYGSVGLWPLSFVAMESTARGVGDFFHHEWQRCTGGKGDKHAVFVGWHEIALYRLAGDDDADILASLDKAETELWRMGVCADQLRWRRRKMREYDAVEKFNAEFPATPEEAFASAANLVFAAAHVDALRRSCRKPAVVGELELRGTAAALVPDSQTGATMVWRTPQEGHRYVVAVDVGGRSAKADWSVVVALDATPGRPPEVVAQWRGHTDHDLLAVKAEAMARYYRNALLIVESNTLETSMAGDTADNNLYVLNRLAARYAHMYKRRAFDRTTHIQGFRVGFHTNASTKNMLIDGLIKAVRSGEYIERDSRACDELMVYEQRPNGSYGAKAGHHDDMLMTRALALHAIGSLPQCHITSFPQHERW